MPDKKISQLPSGTNAQTGDLFVIARSGANYNLTTAELFQTVQTGNGTVGAPALAASADTNTGLYFPEADALAFTTGGMARMRIGATGDVAVDTDTLYVDATNNRVSVGATALSASNNYGVPQLGTNSDAFSTFHVETHNNTAGNYSFIGLMRSRGTRAAPTHVQNGDPIGNLDAQVYNDAGSFPYRRSAAIQFVASGNHAAGSLPTDIAFLTTPSGSNSPSERWRINSSGHLLAGADASFDIGASGANRPRDLFLGRNATVAGNLTVDTNTLFVDATNNRVGVGTTSPVGSGPSLNISVAGGVSQLLVSDTGDATDQKHWTWQTGLSVGAGVFRLRALNDALTDGRNAYILTRSGMEIQTHQWLTANTERMRLDASGNLGLGVTPSANWFAGAAALQFGSRGGLASSTSYTGLTNNLVATSGGYAVQYLLSAAAAAYLQGAGTHEWYSAPSGTAGNAVTLTQRWQINSSGHLLAGADASYDIGASGATRPRDVFIARDLNVDGGTLYVDATNNRVGIGTASPGAGSRLDIRLAADETSWIYHANSSTGASGAVGINLFTNSGGGDLRVVANNSNNTSGPGASGCRIFNAANAVLQLGTNNTERLIVKAEGSVRFVPLAAAPTTNVQDGDVYYDSGTNKLRVRAAGAWTDLH